MIKVIWMSQVLIIESLEFIKTGGFRPGKEMEEAHQICQLHEGERLFDWVHALVHRIEGDDSNAGYWYRRAGKTREMGPIEDEWKKICTAVEET
ncbi:hypothetical protein AB9F26_09245 [Falsihalocynthiibacter sp. BN13B15]|uniref:hypothetical protein n=1 Tax=Falsihalocynthiibacter sp. BN13B15 TaxID=3240871 RepID=UPI0035107635